MRSRIIVIVLFLAAMLAFYALFPDARREPAPTSAPPSLSVDGG